jgi:hypothetical protein
MLCVPTAGAVYSFPRSCVGMQTVAEPSTDMGSHAGAWEPEELGEIVRLIACLLVPTLLRGNADRS